MAYRYGNRYQMELLRASIEDYVNPDDPVRVGEKTKSLSKIFLKHVLVYVSDLILLQAIPCLLMAVK